MKIRHVYTVTREFDIEKADLDKSVELFEERVKTNPEGHLYPDPMGKETATVEMQVFHKGAGWQTIYGDHR